MAKVKFLRGAKNSLPSVGADGVFYLAVDDDRLFYGDGTNAPKEVKGYTYTLTSSSDGNSVILTDQNGNFTTAAVRTVPAGGSNGQALVCSSDGKSKWGVPAEALALLNPTSGAKFEASDISNIISSMPTIEFGALSPSNEYMKYTVTRHNWLAKVTMGGRSFVIGQFCVTLASSDGSAFVKGQDSSTEIGRIPEGFRPTKNVDTVAGTLSTSEGDKLESLTIMGTSSSSSPDVPGQLSVSFYAQANIYNCDIMFCYDI